MTANPFHHDRTTPDGTRVAQGSLLDRMPARERADDLRPLAPHAAARVRALRRARRNAQVNALRVRRILLTGYETNPSRAWDGFAGGSSR